MTADKYADELEILSVISPPHGRFDYWVLTDGPDAMRFAEAANEVIRASDDDCAPGKAGGLIRRALRNETESFPGIGFDLRGAVSMAEVRRRMEDAFLPPGERNVYAGYGDKWLEVEINRCRVSSHKEWPDHRDHTLRTASDMQRELDLRKQERLDTPEEEAEASPAPGM